MSLSKLLDLKSSRIACGTGLIALDIIMIDGEDGAPRYRAGGTCGNVLAVLCYLGWRGYPVGRLGIDAAGNLLVEDLIRWRVDVEFVRCDKPVATPRIVERLGQSRDELPMHRFSFRCPRCRAWLPTYRPVTAAAVEAVRPRLPEADVFFMDRLSRGALRLADHFKRKGAMIVFEPPSVSQERLFQEALEKADVVKYSLGQLGEVELGEAVALEVATMGREGLRYRRKGKNGRMRAWRELEAFEVHDAKDTAGAGDWLTAGMLHGIFGARGKVSELSDEKVESAMRFGQLMAAWSCRFEGARGGMYEAPRAALREELRRLEERDTTSRSRAPRNKEHGLWIAGMCPSCG